MTTPTPFGTPLPQPTSSASHSHISPLALLTPTVSQATLCVCHSLLSSLFSLLQRHPVTPRSSHVTPHSGHSTPALSTTSSPHSGTNTPPPPPSHTTQYPSSLMCRWESDIQSGGLGVLPPLRGREGAAANPLLPRPRLASHETHTRPAL